MLIMDLYLIIMIGYVLLALAVYLIIIRLPGWRKRKKQLRRAEEELAEMIACMEVKRKRDDKKPLRG